MTTDAAHIIGLVTTGAAVLLLAGVALWAACVLWQATGASRRKDVPK
jgi:hypothetical protein